MTTPAASERSSGNESEVTTSVSHARRRNRGYNPDASFDQSKQQFMSAVDDAIKNLMQQCGYSRARAVAALLHEFRREVSTPNDEEVFRAMQLYGLGIEDASRALIVSSAVLRAVKGTGGSFVEAIDDLAEKLSLTNMRAMSECADLSDVDERPRSPDRRIEAVSACDRPSSLSRKLQTTGSNKKGKVASKNVKAKSSSKLSTKNGTTSKPATRKRSIEEVNQGDKKVILRELPGSVGDDVDAKVAMKCKEDDNSLPEAAAAALRTSTQSVVTRAKRTHRVDDGTTGVQATTLKRARTSEA